MKKPFSNHRSRNDCDTVVLRIGKTDALKYLMAATGTVDPSEVVGLSLSALNWILTRTQQNKHIVAQVESPVVGEEELVLPNGPSLAT